MVERGLFSRLYRDYRGAGYAERLKVSYLYRGEEKVEDTHALNLCWGASASNFGDGLSPLVVHLLSGKKLAGKNNDSNLASPKLLALGSILERAADGDLVWGAGARGEKLSCSELDIYAVRGPLTREWLLNQGVHCPEVYGDPAILMPWLYQPNTKEEFDVGLIQHYADKSVSKPLDSNISVNRIDVTSEPLNVIDEICKCKTIISSSLHGVVLAEAYGIPACWLRPADHLWNYPEPSMKYEDYFLGTGRDPQPCRFDGELNIAEAVRFAATVEKPQFQQQELLASFPFLREGIRELDDLKRFSISFADVNVSLSGFAGFVAGRVVKKLKAGLGGH
ncbi:polysaccharide pyruvyl transferase family protein [Pseudomonadota bacterium]